jgi:AraC family transcriptional regulator of adaptative response/methylated-DNA-[protein]-cysteine methyltransferase
MKKSNINQDRPSLEIEQEVLKKKLINHESMAQKRQWTNINLIFETPADHTFKIVFGWFKSPYGPMLLSSTEKGICGLAFADEYGEKKTISKMFEYWPNANFQQNDDALVSQSRSILEHKEPLNIHMIGSPFQINVWKTLLKIPTGSVTSYSDIAYQLKRPKAVRAIASAIGRNPICWLIPCHRVIRKTGNLGGYRWGLNIKNNILKTEF